MDSSSCQSQSIPTGPGVPTESAELTGYFTSFFLETLLFGAFTVTYTTGACSLLTSLASRSRSIRDWAFLGASTTMFVLAFVHLALSFKLTLVGFVSDDLDSGFDDDGFEVYIGLLRFAFSSSLWYARLGIYVTQTLIGDVFMIYRLFLVWNRSRKVIILPAILCLVHGVCGYVTLGGLLSQSVIDGWGLSIAPARLFTLLAFFSLSFTSNVSCSALIIWRVFRSMNQYTPPSARLKLFRTVVEAIVQSAAIYSMASLALVITTVASRYVGFNICISMFPSLIGLVFSFIVLRMARISEKDAAQLASSFHTGSGRPTDKSRAATSPSRPMNVRLPIPPIPPPVLDLATNNIPEDLHVTASSSASTSSAQPAEVLLRNSSSFAHDLEGPPGEEVLGILNIRASKSLWNV
ncbi:hypothetical protein VTO73DRAFT_11950 [Trametes versicolor]